MLPETSSHKLMYASRYGSLPPGRIPELITLGSQVLTSHYSASYGYRRLFVYTGSTSSAADNVRSEADPRPSLNWGEARGGGRLGSVD